MRRKNTLNTSSLFNYANIKIIFSFQTKEISMIYFTLFSYRTENGLQSSEYILSLFPYGPSDYHRVGKA